MLYFHFFRSSSQSHPLWVTQYWCILRGGGDSGFGGISTYGILAFVYNFDLECILISLFSLGFVVLNLI